MALRSLSVGWCMVLGTLVLGLAVGCGGDTKPPSPPDPPAKELPHAGLSKVEVSPATGVVADGKDAATLTVTVLKADGTPLADHTVQLEVSGEGNTVTPASGKTNAEGKMTATLVSTSAGTKTVTARVDAEGGPVTLNAKPTVEFVAPPVTATKLGFRAVSQQATAGVPLSPVEVEIQDANGNRATGATGAVTLELATGPASAQLEGTLTANAVDGVARFSDLVIKTAGTGYSLKATSGAFTAATSTTFTVVPAAASVLEWAGLPASMTAGETANVQVTLKDAFGNVATNYTGTLHFSSTDASAVLPADYTFMTGDAGSASFPVELRTAGDQSVTVTDTGNSALTLGGSVTVNPASAAQLVFSQQPANGTVRATLATVSVALRDAFGNATNATSPSVTLGLTGGTTGAVLSGTLTVDPVSGVASFTDLSVDQEGTGYTLTAAAGALTNGTSQAFDIVDDIAPATAVITATATSDTSVDVSWTAVGDDANLGTASSYELRYATSPITNETEFAAATAVTGMPAPGAPGTSQSKSVTGLSLTVDHYFALKVIDGAGNFSRSASVRVPGQAGSVIISEFQALGSEFIELHNPTAADVDVHGFTFQNAAGETVDIRAPSDPNGTAGTPVTVPAGGFLHGIPNPSGAIPVGVGFVYGAPGTSFALSDTGDALALRTVSTGSLQDAVDFRSFITEPDEPLSATAFVGFAGSSTQLDPGRLTTVGNDVATNWCVSFYPAGARGARIADTAGAANGSCGVAVINEVLIDASGGDDTKTFLEIAGPGGAVIGGAKITDIEGKSTTGTPGTLNTDTEQNTGDADGEFTLPAGTRIPADGILLIADTGLAGTTQVSGFVAGVDVLARDIDLENETTIARTGESIQLISASGALLDALGHEPAGANLDAATASNGLAMYETATALSPNFPSAIAPTLARNPASTDTGSNYDDFHADPTPTPGQPNDTVNFTISGLSPDDAPARTGTSGIAVAGTDFSPGMRIQFGGNPSSPCTVNSTTVATCTATANPGFVPARMDVTLINPPSVKVSNAVLPSGFTYTGSENETGGALEADFCNLQSPATLTVQRGQTTEQIFGKLFEAGVTETAGAPSGVIAEVGYGASGTHPNENGSWRFFPAAYNTQVVNDDEFVGTFVAPTAANTYSYTFRFSFDNGIKWTYCDLDGAGSNTGADFSTTQLGVMTVQ